MVVGNVPEAVDFVVAGAGPGGYVAALRAAQAGREVLLVDRDGEQGLGGVCLHSGCIPSKALIELAALRARAIDGAAMGLEFDPPALDLEKFQRWKESVIGRLAGGVRALLEGAGVTLLAGELALVDEANAVVNAADGSVRFLSFRDLVLAVGSTPVALEHLPVDGKRVLDSSGVLALADLPTSIAIVGAGCVGVEIGTALAKLGTRVSLIEREPAILPAMDAALTAPVAARLRELGVTLALGARALRLAEGVLEVEEAGGGRRLDAEKVLVAAGRAPDHARLGLVQAGIAVRPDGRVVVAADRRLTAHIAAIGDLTPGPSLAHKAMAEAAVAVDALCGARAAFEPAAIPEVIYSDPQVASAGLTTGQAAARGMQTMDAKFPLAASARASTLDERRGFAQIVAERDDHTVLGVHIVGAHASELIAEGVLAIEMGASLEDLALTIHAHPTLSEALGEAALVALGSPLHLPGYLWRKQVRELS